MKRLIIDSKKMTPEIMALVKEKYPEGYFEDDIIVFKNQKNEDFNVKTCLRTIKTA